MSIGFVKMVVFSMNSKRLRRPNVRLWEIGDVSAAFACASSHNRSDASLGQKKWKSNSCVGESEYLHVSKQEEPEYTILDPSVSPRIFGDVQHNRENQDPNSFKIVTELVNSNETNMSKCKLDFGTVMRRSRCMRRRRRNLNGTSSLFGDPWNSKPGREISSEDEKESRWNRRVERMSDAGLNVFPFNGFKDASQTETSAMSKEALEDEIDDPNFSREMLQKPKEFLTEGAWYEENTNFLKSVSGRNEKVSSDGVVNNVSEWLEELGFVKFAKLFEMHEVDKETLPLLTFEDLKDMGIVAVGPCRKLFTAIQQLRGGS